MNEVIGFFFLILGVVFEFLEKEWKKYWLD